jgi:hypothetical protein
MKNLPLSRYSQDSIESLMAQASFFWISQLTAEEVHFLEHKFIHSYRPLGSTCNKIPPQATSEASVRRIQMRVKSGMVTDIAVVMASVSALKAAR